MPDNTQIYVTPLDFKTDTFSVCTLTMYMFLNGQEAYAHTLLQAFYNYHEARIFAFAAAEANNWLILNLYKKCDTLSKFEAEKAFTEAMYEYPYA